MKDDLRKLGRGDATPEEAAAAVDRLLDQNKEALDLLADEEGGEKRRVIDEPERQAMISALLSHFPEIFPEYASISCRPDWAPQILAMLNDIKQILENENEEGAWVEIFCIEEKLGNLRIKCHTPHKAIIDLIDDVEAQELGLTHYTRPADLVSVLLEPDDDGPDR